MLEGGNAVAVVHFAGHVVSRDGETAFMHTDP